MDMVTQLFQKVDQTALTAVQSIYDAISQGLLPVFTVALTVYVVYWGYEMIYGRASLTAGAFIWRIVRIAIIYTFAFHWSDFSSIVVDVFTKGADGVASAVCTGVGGTGCGTPETSVASSLSTLFTNAMTAAKKVAASGGWGAAIGLALLAILLVTVTVIFLAAAITLVLIGKVALFVLLGLGPIFIAMALFNFSSVLFTGWLRTCAQYAIVPAIVYAILGFLLTLMSGAVKNIGLVTDVSSGLTVIAPFLILCIVGTAMLPLSLSIAASIAGGYALQNTRPFSPIARAAGTAFGGAVGGAWLLAALGNRAYQSGRNPPTITPGSNTLQGGDPRAEQVAAALIASRAARLRSWE